MYLDNPMSVAYEAAKAAHFGRHPLGNSILGTVESITALQVEQMRDYFARRYSPANIVLAFAGKGDWEQLVELAGGHCGGWQGGPAARQAVPVRGTGAFQTMLRAEDQQQTVVGVCDAPPLETEDRYAAHLLATILGDHTGSRLYWALIDPGHADGAELSYQDYNQAGAFFTFLSCEPGETQANLGRIAEVYREVMAEGVTEEELTQAKNKVLARSVLRSERPMGRLASLGFHWMYRRGYLSVEDELEAFSRVTLDAPPPRAARLAALAHDHRFRRADDRDATAAVKTVDTGGKPRSLDANRQSAPPLHRAGLRLGHEHELVGVTHECDDPPGVETLPWLTRSNIPNGPSHPAPRSTPWSRPGSKGACTRSMRQGLAELQPDLILTQEQW